MATADHIEENWQRRETIRERNKFMFKNSLLSDVKFLPLAASEVKDETTKTQAAIPAHKYVLAIGSPVFFAMFYGELAETTDPIELPDCDSESFLELLRYLYCDEVKLSGSNVMQVLYLANKYVVPSLATKCSEFLASNLGPENVFAVFPGVIKLEDKSLVNKCWEVIDNEGSQAVKSEPFKCIDKTLLVSVLQRSTINCPEVDLFKAMMEWASNECKRRGRADNGEEKRNVLGEELLCLCRFPLMSQAEFVDTVLEADVLNKKEIVQMFTYFAKFSDEKLCFSNVPRPRAERPEAEVLNMSRFDRYEQPNQIKNQWRYTDGKKDCLTFSVDQPIRIHGVTLFTGTFPSSYNVEFWFKRNQHSTDYLFYTKKILFCFSSSLKEYDDYNVMFDNPIPLSAKREYTIEALIQGPRSFYGQEGNWLRECKGITFTFRDNVSPNGTSATSGQFPRIIFTKLVR